MAKISELVKTYRLLNDPKAPDWNIKFVGGIVIALALIAASGALIWRASHHAPEVENAPAAATQQAPPTCTADDVAKELAAHPDAPIAKGQMLSSGCVVA